MCIVLLCLESLKHSWRVKFLCDFCQYTGPDIYHVNVSSLVWCWFIMVYILPANHDASSKYIAYYKSKVFLEIHPVPIALDFCWLNGLAICLSDSQTNGYWIFYCYFWSSFINLLIFVLLLLKVGYTSL